MGLEKVRENITVPHAWGEHTGLLPQHLDRGVLQDLDARLWPQSYSCKACCARDPLPLSGREHSDSLKTGVWGRLGAWLTEPAASKKFRRPT